MNLLNRAQPVNYYNQDELINHIYENAISFMNEKNIKLLDLQEDSNYGSCWSHICIKVFGSYSFENTELIKKHYSKNVKDLKSNIIKYFRKFESKKKNTYYCLFDKKMIEKYKLNYSRPKANSFFGEKLTLRLQEKCNVNCFLKSKWNWFCCEKNYGNKSSKIWNGLYECIDKDCKKKFNIYMVNHCYDDQKVKIHFSWEGDDPHKSVIKKNEWFTGKKRKEIALEAIANGNQFVMAKLQKSNTDVIRKIKSEYILKNRISRDMLIDTEAIKLAFDESLQGDNKQDICGYVQDISMNPFGMLLISKYQLNIWSIIQKSNPIWYFDAAGEFIMDVRNQDSPLLYALVCHDNERKKIIPMAEFFSTSRTTTTMTTYFLKIKDILATNLHSKVENKLPLVFVTDFTWTFINSFLRVFNNCNVATYLNWCYEIVVEENVDSFYVMPTVVYICCVHFLKNVIEYTDKIIKYKKIFRDSKKYDYNRRINCYRIRSLFIQSFCLLQNSTSLKEFRSYLKKIFIIFKSKFYTDKVDKSIKYLKKVCKNKNLTFEKNVFETIDNKTSKKSLTIIPVTVEKKSNLKKKSKFLKYFNKLLKKVKLIASPKITKYISNRKLKSNPYLNNKLFNLILKRLHLLPFWTGILISKRTNTPKSRLSNMVCEKYFDDSRNNQLNISKKLRTKNRLMPSQFISKKFPIIKNLYEINFENEYKETFKRSAHNDLLLNQKENWQYNHSYKKRRRHTFYSNSNLTEINNEVINETEHALESEFEDIQSDENINSEIDDENEYENNSDEDQDTDE